MTDRLLTSADFDAHGQLELANTGEPMRYYLHVSSLSKSLKIDLKLAAESDTTFFCKIDSSTQIVFNAHIKKHASARFYGLTQLSGENQAEIAVHVHHDEGENLTEQKFFSYADGHSRIKFTGKINVAPGASGVIAHQLHRGIAISPTARIDAQPFLNIMHDDVRCTHGSTIGYIDEDSRRYLMARGISPDAAEKMLIASSQHEFLSAVGADALQKYFGISAPLYE